MMNRVFLLPVVLLIMSASLEAQGKSTVKPDKKSQDPEIVIEKRQIPVVIIDGKKYDSDILRLIDNTLIESVDVYKGEEAEKLYNEQAVVVVTTKGKPKEKQEVRVRFKLPEEGVTDKPVFYIDGRLAELNEAESISPDDIECITVLRDESSKKKYNAESGVILIVLKKKDF